MSYILEALKKAQAERQLGTTPDIHTAPLPVSAPAPARAPRALAYGAGAIVALAVAATFLLRRPEPVPPVPAPAPAPSTASSGGLDQRAVAGAAGQPAAPSSVAVPNAAAGAARNAGEVASRAVDTGGDRRISGVAPAAPAAREHLTAGAPPAADPDDALPTARELPDAVRQGLPQLAFGGYIYASNPADRLLLVDKTLRHEGEEVAPGLVLERLRPHYAVMNFRGTRYRVAY
ncbi:MAG TPA: general secretion pathway protein GspB [Telluria sp.]|nr:general secretion pathway protein GspB [Telluria sp.]